MRRIGSWVLALVVAAGTFAACTGDDEGAGGSAGAGSRPSIVVTTNILGDVVSSLLGDAAQVSTIMPVGANPHDFQPSAREAAQAAEADLLIVNGAGFEEGLLDVIESAKSDGVPVFDAISAVDSLPLSDEHGAEGHDDEPDEEHTVDPHFFTDPARMAVAARAIVEHAIAVVPELDAAAVRASSARYIAQLEALDAELEATLAAVRASDRVLITDHEVFGYFADRYGFEVIGAVIPAGSTSEAVSAADLVELGDLIEREGVPAIFADTSSPGELAQSLAEEAGDVAVVELFSESLGVAGSGGSTYVEMMRTNGQRIVEALT